MLSFSRYRAVLQRSEIRGAIASSILGRLPIGMAGLALMLAAQASTGSFASAGLLTGAYVAGLAILAPWIGRYIDRRGPRGALIVCALAYPAMLAALVASMRFGIPASISALASLVAGAAFPPITVYMRAFLKQRLGTNDAELSAAYSLESLLIESIFIVGPAAVALFVAFGSPEAAVLFAAACAFAGTLLFLGSPALRHWKIEPRETSSILGPLAEPGFTALLATIALYASAFGMVEMGVTGYATEWRNPALAGVLLALMSIGSAAGAIGYGGRVWRAPLQRQFPAMLFLMGGGIATLGTISDPWIFAPLSAFAGIVMAPALIIQSMLVAKIARPIHSTEAFTWSSTALLAGVSGGIALAGSILDQAPASNVFVAAGVAAMLAAALAITLLRTR